MITANKNRPSMGTSMHFFILGGQKPYYCSNLRANSNFCVQFMNLYVMLLCCLQRIMLVPMENGDNVASHFCFPTSNFSLTTYNTLFTGRFW